ncbi:hypothetical protein BCR44DRAFT_66822 [Catenaria anguillulae PL171]|uniref:L domain-like protein n=1 Tax=Catenaria anguillulae PL171 TaxID=765915 RepID=A0A1Y2HDP6_9FUNG|nr:hypothetical protein BCR44DRAFT_66822 [Catenaria anguillulae PL171]
MSSDNRSSGASPDCAVVTKFGFITDSPNCCQSRDVTCRDGRVVAIDSYYWSGRSSISFSSSQSATPAPPKKDFTIPADIDSLTELQRLKLVLSQEASYAPGTTIPPSIGKLSKLTELDIRDGGLVGTIPSEIANIPNLGFLRLSNHSLTGTIPPAIGNLKNLTVLDLSRNKLSGSLPSGLGDRNLTTLNVARNNLTGIVPKLSPTIYNCELTSTFDDGNDFWCYGAGGAAPPSMCDTDTRVFLPRTCPAGLDGSGPSPFLRPGFIATIAIAVLIPLLAVLCVK